MTAELDEQDGRKTRDAPARLGPAPQLVTTEPLPRLQVVAGLVAGGGLVAAVLQLRGATGTAMGVGGLAVVVALGVGWVMTLLQRRRDFEALVLNSVQTVLRCRIKLRCRWRGRRVRRYEISYGQQAQLMYRELLPGRVSAELARAAGESVKLHRHKERRRTLIYVGDAEESSPASALDEKKERIARVAAQVFGAAATVNGVKTNDVDEVIGFTVRHKVGPRLVAPPLQMKTVATVSKMLPGQWRAEFDHEQDEVTFEIRPPFPKMALRPVVDLSEHDPTAIPQGVDEDGNEISWDISGAVAHFLRSGPTRSGKTVTMIGDAVECTRRDFQVFVIDPKRTEFLGLRTWPNVAMVATRVRDQVALVEWMTNLMYERYRQIEEEGANEDDFTRVFLFVDEYRIFVGQVRNWWKGLGGKGECPAITHIGDMLSLAAAARIHVEIGTQRPDAEFLGGDVRDNFSGRGAHGKLSGDGAKMMFGNPHIGTRIRPTERGRGTIIGLDGRPAEIQYYYTPDPRKASKPEELDLLERLRPTTTQWPRQEFSYPTAREIYLEEHPEADDSNVTDDQIKSLEWEQATRARMVPWVGSEHSDPAPLPTDEPPVDELDSDGNLDDTIEEDTDPFDGFAPAERVPVDQVDEGDLVDLDDDDTWTEVNDVLIDDTEVSLEWSALDSDRTSTVILDTDTLVACRKPAVE